MAQEASLDAIWGSTPVSTGTFDPQNLGSLPEAARRYLVHAIAPGAPLVSAVRLWMHGKIRLNGTWSDFAAEQVIRRDAEMRWQAKVKLFGVPITGYDRVHEGEGEMAWHILGIIPLLRASGPDVSRSAIGRVEGEWFWLPTALADSSVTWHVTGENTVGAQLTAAGETTELRLGITETGRVDSMTFLRWGNPEGGPFHYQTFGGLVERERTFGDFTIPSRLRAGWYFGTDRFESEGEFFRVTIDDARFR